MVKSKYKISIIIFTVVFLLLTCTLEAIFIIKNSPDLNKYASLVTFIFFMSLGMIAVLVYRGPQIKMDVDGVSFKRFFINSYYHWGDVTQVKLTTQSNNLFSNYAEGMMLTFANEKRLLVIAAYYKNMIELRSFVISELNERLKLIPKREIRKSTSPLIYKIYKNSPLLHWNTIMLLLPVIMMLVMSRNVPLHLILIASIFITALLFLGLGHQMNYFEIAGPEFIIRNHFFPWKKVTLQIDDIIQVNKERYNKRPDGLRIITADLKSQLFYAGSLWCSTWGSLFADLEELGVKT